MGTEEWTKAKHRSGSHASGLGQELSAARAVAGGVAKAPVAVREDLVLTSISTDKQHISLPLDLPDYWLSSDCSLLRWVHDVDCLLHFTQDHVHVPIVGLHTEQAWVSGALTDYQPTMTPTRCSRGGSRAVRGHRGALRIRAPRARPGSGRTAQQAHLRLDDQPQQSVDVLNGQAVLDSLPGIFDRVDGWFGVERWPSCVVCSDRGFGLGSRRLIGHAQPRLDRLSRRLTGSSD